MDYIILSIITIFSFVIFAKQSPRANNNVELYIYAIIPIILYSITYGFRKGWAIDYTVYDPLYTGDFKLDIEQYEPLFRVIIVNLRSLFESSAALFTLVAAVFISSVIYLLHDKKSLLLYAMPIIYLFSAYQASNLARYFFAMSFVYIAIENLLEKRYIYFGVFSLIGFFIHYSMAVLLPIIIAIYYYDGFKKVWVNLLLYLITAFISITTIQETFISPISMLMSFIDLGDNQLVKYSNHEAIQEVVLGTRWGDVERSIINIISYHSYAIIYIWFGNKIVNSKEYNGKLSFYYQIGVLGLILQNIAQNAEIISRISLFFVYPSLIVTAFMLKYRRIGNVILQCLFVLSILYIGYHNIKGLYDLYNVEYIWSE